MLCSLSPSLFIFYFFHFQIHLFNITFLFFVFWTYLSIRSVLSYSYLSSFFYISLSFSLSQISFCSLSFLILSIVSLLDPADCFYISFLFYIKLYLFICLHFSIKQFCVFPFFCTDIKYENNGPFKLFKHKREKNFWFKRRLNKRFF